MKQTSSRMLLALALGAAFFTAAVTANTASITNAAEATVASNAEAAKHVFPGATVVGGFYQQPVYGGVYAAPQSGFPAGPYYAGPYAAPFPSAGVATPYPPPGYGGGWWGGWRRLLGMEAQPAVAQGRGHAHSIAATAEEPQQGHQRKLMGVDAKDAKKTWVDDEDDWRARAATTGSNVVGSNRWGGGWGANWNNNDGWGWGWGRGGYSPALYYGTWGGDLGWEGSEIRSNWRRLLGATKANWGGGNPGRYNYGFKPSWSNRSPGRIWQGKK